MESKIQKPIQSNRKGEVAEGLPGSLKSVACVKRNTRELGRPNSFLAVEVSEADIKTGKLMTSWESDQLIVLRERESRSQGEPHCVPVVADTEFTAFDRAIRRCWFLRHDGFNGFLKTGRDTRQIETNDSS
jgi:hypothetical protein